MPQGRRGRPQGEQVSPSGTHSQCLRDGRQAGRESPLEATIFKDRGDHLHPNDRWCRIMAENNNQTAKRFLKLLLEMPKIPTNKFVIGYLDVREYCYCTPAQSISLGA